MKTDLDYLSSDRGARRLPPPKVVILGAGFGGMWAARTLANKAVSVVVVDHHNYHTFFPLVYQIAAAELTPGEVALPIRSILRRSPNVDLCLSSVQAIDFASKTIRTNRVLLSYDYLIIALGSTSRFYGIPGASEYAYPLKSLEQAVPLRNHILSCFEQAAHEQDPLRRQQLLTFTLVGGGPTGVEFAGALGELIGGPLTNDIPRLKNEAHIILLEAGPSLLAGQPQRLSHYALNRLQKMGIQVQLNARVNRVGPDQVQLQDGEKIRTETVVWSAGVNAVALGVNAELPSRPNGQIAVLPTLQVPEYPEVYVAGDLAYVEDRGRPLPMMAQPALQEGAAAARNILRQTRGEAPLPFHYHDLGTLAVIGRNAAVANIFGLEFTGLFAWLVWLGVHIYNLIGFRNRVVTLVNWAWDYFFFERGIRVILPSDTPVETLTFAYQHPARAVHPGAAHERDQGVSAKQPQAPTLNAQNTPGKG